jgi:hypothetical protein
LLWGDDVTYKANDRRTIRNCIGAGVNSTPLLGFISPHISQLIKGPPWLSTHLAVMVVKNKFNLSAYDNDSKRLCKILPAFHVISLHPWLASVLGGDDVAYKLAIKGIIMLYTWISWLFLMANVTCSNSGLKEGW